MQQIYSYLPILVRLKNRLFGTIHKLSHDIYVAATKFSNFHSLIFTFFICTITVIVDVGVSKIDLAT